MTAKYTLELINSDTLKKFRMFDVDGINTIGVEELEPFIIKFRNNTYNRVQVKLSVDGTDIITGKLASTDLSGQMFLVEGYGTLELKAWPEDFNGGAKFLFASAGEGVASTLHGENASKGYIAAAVYEESHVFREEKTKGIILNDSKQFKSKSILREYSSCSSDQVRSGETKGINYNNTSVSDSISLHEIAEMDSMNIDYERSVEVGAGERVEQKLTKVAGLRSPKFSQIVQIKYLPWTTLRSRIKYDTNKLAGAHPAFPGDRQKLIDLKSTPRYEPENKTPTVIKRVRRLEQRQELLDRYKEIERYE